MFGKQYNLKPYFLTMYQLLNVTSMNGQSIWVKKGNSIWNKRYEYEQSKSGYVCSLQVAMKRVSRIGRLVSCLAPLEGSVNWPSICQTGGRLRHDPCAYAILIRLEGYFGALISTRIHSFKPQTRECQRIYLARTWQPLSHSLRLVHNLIIKREREREKNRKSFHFWQFFPCSTF